jgi:U6 snRNA-associated Sm-like protein LSm7
MKTKKYMQDEVFAPLNWNIRSNASPQNTNHHHNMVSLSSVGSLTASQLKGHTLMFYLQSRKESVLDLSKYLDQRLHVKFVGGREVTGILKGYDQLVNLVLDDTKEILAGDENTKEQETTRDLGLVVCRGTTLLVINPADGTQEIANPFVQQE